MYQYIPDQPTLHDSPVRFNTEISSTVDFWQYGSDCFSLFAHQRTRYLGWLGFFDEYREVFDKDCSNYIQALNFLMKNDFLIATQDDCAQERSILFMSAIAETDLILDNVITAQALLSIATFYGSHGNNVPMNDETFPLTGKIYLSDCIIFYRTCFYRHFQLPTFIALNTLISDAQRKHIVTVLFENGDLRKHFPEWELSRKELHLLLNTSFKQLGYDLAPFHYVMAVRLLKFYPKKQELVLQVLANSQIFLQNIHSFKKDLPFWKGVVAFFVAHPETIWQYSLSEYLDYIEYFRYDNSVKKEDFSIKNRTINSLSCSVDFWHPNGHAFSVYHKTDIKWKAGHYRWVEMEVGGNLYTIVELCSSQELIAESKALAHCVHSYINRCKNGNSKIFSLKKMEDETFVPCCTIEVKNEQIVQVGGHSNRKLNDSAWKVLEEWSDRNELKLNLES